MRGMICYTSGAVLYALTGLLHALAHFAPPPTEASLVAAQKAMTEAVQEMAGLSFSFDDILHCLSWFMTVFSLLVGTLAFALRKACRADARLLRTTSMLMALGAAVLAGLGLRYGIFPPILFYSLAAIAFAAAALRARA